MDMTEIATHGGSLVITVLMLGWQVKSLLDFSKEVKAWQLAHDAECKARVLREQDEREEMAERVTRLEAKMDAAGLFTPVPWDPRKRDR